MAIVINKTKRVIILNDNIESVRLLAGASEVPSEQWLRVREHVQDRIGPGKDFEEKVDSKKTDNKSKLGKDAFYKFSDLSDAEAIAVVETTLDIVTLEKWKDGCAKDSVRMAIMNRISVMKERG